MTEPRLASVPVNIPPTFSVNKPWLRDAACADDVGMKTHDLAHESKRYWDEARDYCEVCPVREACLQDALESERGIPKSLRFGVRGGLVPSKRAELDEKGDCACGVRGTRGVAHACEVVQDYRAGKPVASIATDRGMPERSVHSMLERCGVKRQTPKRAANRDTDEVLNEWVVLRDAGYTVTSAAQAMDMKRGTLDRALFRAVKRGDRRGERPNQWRVK